MSLMTMAKAKQRVDADQDKAPPESRVRDASTLIRSTSAWKEHVERLADLDRAPSVSDFFDRAVAEYARSRGFDPPPKR